MSEVVFVLGGIRSGKSAYAEGLVRSKVGHKIYLATAALIDREIEKRIELHKEKRGGDWQLIEEQVEIAKFISSYSLCESPTVILLDCLTLWLSNLMYYNVDIKEKTEELLLSLKNTKADIVIVSNEVGQGIIPDNAAARKFCDEAGILHQKIAAVADEVILVAAGIPVKIK